MDSLQKATGAAGTVTLGDQTYLLTRAKAKDLAQWRAFIKKKMANAPDPFDRIRDSLKLLSSRDRKEVLKLAYENRIASTSLDSPQAREIMEGTEATAFLLWLSIRNEHPDVKYEDILARTEECDLSTLHEALDAINGMGPAKKEEERNGQMNGEMEKSHGG